MNMLFIVFLIAMWQIQLEVIYGLQPKSAPRLVG